MMGVYYSDHGRDLMKKLCSEAQLTTLVGEMKSRGAADQIEGQDWVQLPIWTAG